MDSRLALGLSIEANTNEIRSALIRVTGSGMDCQVESLACASIAEARPSSTSANSPRGEVRSADDLPFDAVRLGARLFEAVRTVAARASIALDQVMILSVLGEAGSREEAEVVTVSSRLAEVSGITTLAGLSSSDRAAGGRGKPLSAIVDWLLANDQRFSRLMVHVDGMSRISQIPARCGPATVRTMETGPGVELLDSLASALSQGRHHTDARGMLAVQGRQINPLIRRWATHPFLREELPKYLDPMDFAGPFIDETIQLTVERGWSVADVLCTATHFIAACPADVVRQFMAKERPTDQVVLVGKGTQNGFLLRLLEGQFAGLGLTTVPLSGVAPEAYEAVAAAVLACLTLDGVPASLPAVTGAAGPRLLGQFAPGTQKNWHRCIDWMQRTTKHVAVRAA